MLTKYLKHSYDLKHKRTHDNVIIYLNLIIAELNKFTEFNNLNDIDVYYESKKNEFNTPAFNFDEVCEIPENSIVLASNSVNDVMGLNINYKNSVVWGMQYHSDYEYKQTINLTNLRKEIPVLKERTD